MPRLLLTLTFLLLSAPLAYAADAAVKSCTTTNDPDELIKGCGQLIDRGSRVPLNLRALAYIMRGTIFRDRHEDDRAIADMNEAIRLQPTFEDSYAVRGDAYMHKGNLDAAFADYNESVRRNPQFALGYAQRGEVYRKRGEFQKALTEYNSAIRFDPKPASYFFNRAGVHESLGELDAAIQDWTTNIGLKPTAWNYAQRGRLYDLSRDFARATADFDAALRIDPNSAYAYALRSDADLKAGNVDQAITDANNGIRVDPKSALAYENRGDGLRTKGQFQDALADYDKAATLDPTLKQAVESRDKLRADIENHRTPVVDVSPAPTQKAEIPVAPTALAPVADQTGRRIALIVGNSAYAALPKLDNPRHDAEDLAEALTGLGFQVTLVVDAGRDAMEDKFANFAKAARESDVALIFFAGHGLQFNGTNYIVPVDAHVDDETDLRHLIPVQSVIDDLDNAPSVRLLILDACRETGVIQRLAASLPAKRGVSVKRGLQRDEAAGTFIAYSTQSGSVADDGTGGRNSPFTKALLKHLPDNGIDVRVLFTRVRGEVYKATDGGQNPEVSDSLVGEFSFK